ncbi:MAG: bifunctional nicotinamide mononucleotide adenylyltransferase/ADP-ribose pyrophosphatase [Bacteroidetes bacterium ADurb.Bin217]|nr:MAG: bifunctional nicotinamide mononucleotide adenylyltransferase/ADP-ribose pyrophosphatase [Bacteroidetes bacterium ADurb.Bin217]
MLSNKWINMTDTLIDNLSIDCVIFGFDNEELKILCIKRNTEPDLGMMALPGGFVYLQEDLDKAPARRLKDLTGLTNVYMKEVGTFGNVNRYPLRRVITIAYYALIKISDYVIHAGEDAQEATWIPVKQVPKMVFDHNTIFTAALLKLRERVRMEPIGFNLLPEKFTITELQTLYEQILDTKFDKRNFRKKLAKMNLLIDTNEKQQNVSHRAAKLYSFDTKVYESLIKKGFVFDL